MVENCYNNKDIRNCNGKEEEYKKEDTWRDSFTDKTTTRKIENKEEYSVTNPDIRMNITKYTQKKFGRELSTKDGRTEICLPKYLKEAIKKIPGFNLSAFVKDKLIEFLKQIGIKIEEPELDLLILVKCPYCNSKFVTSSVKIVRCEWCRRPFRRKSWF